MDLPEILCLGIGKIAVDVLESNSLSADLFIAEFSQMFAACAIERFSQLAASRNNRETRNRAIEISFFRYGG